MKKLILSVLLCSSVLEAKPVFISSLTQGIYVCEFHSETGVLSKARQVSSSPSSFLAFHPKNAFLYSIGSKDQISAYSIDKENSLTLINTGSSDGGGVCHLAIDPSGKTLAAANYFDGSFVTLRLLEDGKLGEQVSYIQSEGTGPNQKRQERAHAHGVYFDQSNQYLFVPDLGIDKVLIVGFNSVTSSLFTEEISEMEIPPGSGPRHMAFSPNESHAYVVNELNNQITVAEFDKNTGDLNPIQQIRTLPENFKGESSTAEIEVHSSGNFVYCSNRGHDSISVFRRDPKTGQLSPIQHAPCGGKVPRHFKIDSSGKWLLCAHQKSHTVSVMSLDPKTGLLSPPQCTISVPDPMCILDLAK